MRRHFLTAAFTGLVVATFFTFTSASSSLTPVEASSSLLSKRSYGYSYCTDHRDKLVFKQGQCSCNDNPNPQWTKCLGPKTPNTGKAVCGSGGCNILCNDDDMIVKNGDCKCKDGFNLHNGRCIAQCGQYEAYDREKKECICAPSCSRNRKNSNRCEPSCGENEEWKNDQCKCISGFELNNKNGKCKPKCNGDHEEVKPGNNNKCQCEIGYQYNDQGKCKAICKGDHELYNPRNGQCKCEDGFEKDNKNKNKCKPICNGDNEEFKQGRCKCKDGFVRNENNGKCKPRIPNCGNNMEWNGHRCVCKPGCNPHPGGNTCNPPQCRSNEIYNPEKNRCVCKPNFERTLWGFCVPDCPKKNEYWNGEKCVCKPGCWRNPQDTCEPSTPSHRPQPPQQGGGGGGGGGGNKFGGGHKFGGGGKFGGDPPAWSRKFHTRDQDAHFCPDSLSACPISSLQGGYECVDTTQELENCGGCAIDGNGTDCTLIPGTSGVGCLSGKCVVFSCTDGYRLSSAGACVPSLVHRL